MEELYKNPERHNLNSNQATISEKMTKLESAIKNNQCPLDYPITIEELQEIHTALKSGKACGIDNIKNEMLKHSSQTTTGHPKTVQSSAQKWNFPCDL